MPREIGIDLGHTNLRAAWLSEPGRPQILPNSDNERVTTTALAVHTDGQILVGRSATSWTALHPERGITDVLARLAAGEPVPINGSTCEAAALAARLLSRLKTDAETRMGEAVARAFVAIPPTWGDAARERLRAAGEQAQLPLSLIDSPIAAALAAGFRGAAGGPRRILVYDLGGTTFSAAVLACEDSSMGLLKAGALEGVGGASFDQQIVDYVTVLVQQQHRLNASATFRFMAELRKQAEQAKVALGVHRTSDVIIMGGLRSAAGASIDVEVDIGREEFERMIEDKVAATIALTRSVIAEAGLTLDAIDAVVLVGGSTCVPCVRAAVEALFGPRKIVPKVDPLESVALGAAWLTGPLEVKILPPGWMAAAAVEPLVPEPPVEDEIPTVPPEMPAEPAPSPEPEPVVEPVPEEPPAPEPVPVEVAPEVPPQPEPVVEPTPVEPPAPEPVPVEVVPEPPPQPEPVLEPVPEEPLASEPVPVEVAPEVPPQPEPVVEPTPVEPPAPEPVPVEVVLEVPPAPEPAPEEPPAPEPVPVEEPSHDREGVVPRESLRLGWEEVPRVQVRRRFSAPAFVRIGAAGVMHLATPAEADGPCLGATSIYLGSPLPENLEFTLVVQQPGGAEARAVISVPVPASLTAGDRIEVSLVVDYETGVPGLELKWQARGETECGTLSLREWSPVEEEPVAEEPPPPPPVEEPAPPPPPEPAEAAPVVAVVEEAPTVPEPPKALLGPYELLEPVESGRYYDVMLGRDPSTGDRVLITVFSVADERGRNALLSSLLPLGVDHPNVLRLLDFGRCPQGCWVATEYAGSRTLRDLMGVGPDRQPAPMDRVLALMVQVCEGLQALHQRHIFHRNLKPSNILIDAEAKSAKIIDFQIAVSLRGRDQVTQVAGTLPYMAKEVLEGHADQRADIYSVGVMLYELLTGKLPFWATSQRALVEQISSVPAPEPKSLNAALPEYLNDAILRALSKDPARRFQTAAELRDALVAGEARPEPESWLSTITPESTAP